MSASYSGNPATSPKDEVRFLLGDTAIPFKISDEEIAYLLGDDPPASGNYLAAANAADRIAVSLSAGSTTAKRKKVGDLEIERSDNSETQSKYYATLAKRLRAQGGYFRPYVGGASASEKLGVYENTDRVGTAFEIDGMNARLRNPERY